MGKHICKLLTNYDIIVPRSLQYDLRCEHDVKALFHHVGRVDLIINLAANVGGIGYNQLHPYLLFYDNMQIGINMIHQSIEHRVDKFVQVGTVCAYPKYTRIPFDERSLWDGYPEETNAPYGLAKRMALVQLQAARQEFGFNGIFLLPTNLYGPGDNFNPERSHVIPALIRKVVKAKKEENDTVEVWGSGTATRDFLYVEDAAEGIVKAAMDYNSPNPLNLGSGQETRISALIYEIIRIIQYDGKIHWQTNKPDGQPRRLLNINQARHAIGWEAKVSLREGLKKTIDWYYATN